MADNETPPTYEQEQPPKKTLIELHINYMEIHHYYPECRDDNGVIVKPFMKVFLIKDKWTGEYIEDKEVCEWLIKHNNTCIMPMNIAVAIKRKSNKDMSGSNYTGVSVLCDEWRQGEFDEIGLNHYGFTDDGCIIINNLMEIYKMEEEEEIPLLNGCPIYIYMVFSSPHIVLIKFHYS